MIEDLELRGGPVVLHKDEWTEDVMLPDPRDLHFQAVLTILRDWRFEVLADRKITIWSIEKIMNLWRAAHDLPDVNAAVRLSYVIDHYESALTYDLQKHLGVDLATLWRERRWGTLLGYIDRLPSNTWYSQAVSEDPEHTALLAKQIADAKALGESAAQESPPIHTWSPEVAKLTDIEDAIKSLIYVTASANSEKKVPEPPLALRPRAELREAIARAERDLRKAKHEDLAARLLPGRKKS